MNARKVIQIAERITNGLVEYFQSDQFSGNCFNAVLSSMILAKSLRTRTWSDIQVFGQLDISDDDAAKLLASDIKTIDDLLKSNPREIEDVIYFLDGFFHYWNNTIFNELLSSFRC